MRSGNILYGANVPIPRRKGRHVDELQIILWFVQIALALQVNIFSVRFTSGKFTEVRNQFSNYHVYILVWAVNFWVQYTAGTLPKDGSA